MRSVYTFNRTAAETTAALSKIFDAGGTAREQLSLHADMVIEPVGWDALWKLSKEFCKKFDVRYPCVAYVSVANVDVESLTACVEVQSVQHEAVTLPETVQDVPLIELWPTVKQHEQCLDITGTAEFIDLMRFFYNHIWMPWDEQDDKVLLPNTIEERMQLWMELHDGTIPPYIARAVTLLRNSAIDAHERLRELDSSLCEDSGDEDDSLLPPNYITLCAELTARLDIHMAKWTLYEKALIRKPYLVKEQAKWQKNKSKRNVAALWKGGSVFDFEQISNYLRQHLTNEHSLTVTPSVEDALSLEPEEMVICSNTYEVPEVSLSHIIISSFKGTTLKSPEMRSCLMMLSEQTSLRDLTLQCARVNTTVVALKGAHTVQGCHLSDDSSNSHSDFAQGIVVMPEAKVLIENTTFNNFYTGIVVHKDAKVELRNCTIRNCGVGIQMFDGARVTLALTRILNCTEHALRADAHCGTDKLEGLHIGSDCTIGSGDLDKEILIVKQDSGIMYP